MDPQGFSEVMFNQGLQWWQINGRDQPGQPSVLGCWHFVLLRQDGLGSGLKFTV